jgi:hypothetical protein
MFAKRPTRVPAEFSISLTTEEILEDLSYPGPPPGRWQVPAATERPRRRSRVAARRRGRRAATPARAA